MNQDRVPPPTEDIGGSPSPEAASPLRCAWGVDGGFLIIGHDGQVRLNPEQVSIVRSILNERPA